MRTFRIVMTTIAVVLAVVAAVGGGVGYYIKHRFFDAASKPIPVQLETVTTGDLIELVSAPGEIEPKKRVTISAKTTARIMRLPYDEGEAVTAGDPNADPPVPASVLVALDDRDLRSQLRSAQAGRAAQQAQVKVEGARILGSEARLRALRVSLKQAELEQARTRQLCATGDLSQADLDLAETKVEELRARIEGDEQALEAQRLGLVVLEHNLEVADARIEQAEEALSYTTILSPIDGVITQLNAEEGEMVVTGTMNNPGTTIMVVADLERMLVPAQVDETDVGRVAVGQKARVRVQAFDEEEFTGTVDSIALTHRMSATGTRYYRTEVLVHTEGRTLYSGLTADVDIETETHTDVVKVPSQAVLGRKVEDLPPEIRTDSAEVDTEKTYVAVVYRFSDGKAVVTPVTIGPSDLTHTVIESGIRVGDTIITGPYKILDKLEHDRVVVDELETAEDADAEGPAGAGEDGPDSSAGEDGE